MSAAEIEPFCQGHFECLCGFYSVVNAARYLLPGKISDDDEAEVLFRKLIRASSKKDVFRYLLEGVIAIHILDSEEGTYVRRAKTVLSRSKSKPQSVVPGETFIIWRATR